MPRAALTLTAVLAAAVLATACSTAIPGPAPAGRAPSTPAAGAADPGIVDHPISFSETRQALTRAYIREHYGIDAEDIAITPRVIVLHWTAIDDLEGSFRAFDPETLGGSRPDLEGAGNVNVSIQFLVGKDGTIYRLMPETWMARHVIGLNYESIGVENVGTGSADGRGSTLTGDQVEANIALVRYLVGKYPTIEYLIGHHEYRAFEGHPLWRELDDDYRTHKVDPGGAFMAAVRAGVADLGLRGPPVPGTDLAPGRTVPPRDDGTGARSAPPEALARATQLVVVTTPGWDSTTGELRRYAREDTASPWRPVADDGALAATTPVVIGRTGLAWGIGFDALAAAWSAPLKREGDGRSPAGAFPLPAAFGFAPAGGVAGLELPYLPLAEGLECVDDTASAYYNRVVDRVAVGDVDWTSAERMRRIPVYRLGVVVGYNETPVTGRGSCIFLHVWEGPASTTAGCTAFDETALGRVVAWLDPAAWPVLVQLPAGVYEGLRGEWGLP